jgi:aryl-alcohol dehydrogenase-like predicted oxidoreductase
MVLRPLGRSGILVPPLGLGTVKLGRNAGVKYPGGFELPTDQELETLLEAALDLGVTLWDTAPAYGESETRLGPHVARHRGRIVLCTKCGELFRDGRSIHDFSVPALEASLESSLRRLRTDYVDILLIHSDGKDSEILGRSEVLAFLERCKKAGLARAVGISAKTEEGIRMAAQALDLVMAPFSLGDPSLRPGLARVHAAGLGVITIKGLDSGHLKGRRPLDLISHVLAQPFVDTMVLGTLDPAHLKEAVLAARGVPSERPGP